MPSWVQDNHIALERDLLQDFCMASVVLNEQLDRYSLNGTISFSILHSLVGERLDEGLLWRIKDTAHHLFRSENHVAPVGILLDWTMGYIFHETRKLAEDAHQRQYYAPVLNSLLEGELPPELSTFAGKLLAIQRQTRVSIGRESARLATLIHQARKFFCLYFADRATHQPVARLLNDRNDLVRKAFQSDYPNLISAIYGSRPELMHVTAAHSLLESAKNQEALKALEAAIQYNPNCREAQDLLAAGLFS